MVQFLSSILLLCLFLTSSAQSIDHTCRNIRRTQFFELFQPKFSSPSQLKLDSYLYSRPLLIPSSPENDEINVTEQCATNLLDPRLDVPPPANFVSDSKGHINLTGNDENSTIIASNDSVTDAHGVEVPVVTFEEWTKQKLEQEKLKHHSVTNGNHHHQNVDHLAPATNDKAAAQITETVVSTTTIEEKVQTSRVVHTIPVTVSQRNYASKECGAKVIEANSESENRGAILNDKEKDEYMRNPCGNAKEKYLVIELCETIQPTSIEIANYEYFSSSPKNFKILGSERQPPFEWATLGEFEAADTRDVQFFQIPENGVYTKFIRLELLSHYGKEHYCTLSSLRVYGISMVDEYEAEATAAANFDNIESPGIPIKSSTSEIKPNDSVSAKEEPLITAPSIVSEQIQLEPIFDLNPLNVAEPSTQLFPPLVASWKFRECSKCSDKNLKDVTARLCNVFSPSLCSQRSIETSRNITSLLPRSQSKFLKLVLNPTECPINNGTTEKIIEDGAILPSAKPLESVVMHTIETEVKKQTIVQQKQTSTVPLPAGTTSHKESVFLKLNKRLASLELNISLSSQYLTELSRQYVAQTEENKKNQEKITKFIEESIAKASLTLTKQFSDQIYEVKQQVHDLFKHFKSFPHSSTSNIAHGKFKNDHDGSLMIQYPLKDHCRTDYDNIYLDESDGLWTTQQLVVVIAVMQATTFAMIFILQYLWKTNAQASQKVALISSDVDIRKIIAAEIQNEMKQFLQQQPSNALVLPNTCSPSSSENPTVPTIPSSLGNATTNNSSSPLKKRRKKKRNTNSMNAFIIPESDKWDSTSVSSNISAPSTNNCCSASLSSSSIMKKKGSTASRDSCFTSDSTTENVPPEPPSSVFRDISSNHLEHKHLNVSNTPLI